MNINFIFFGSSRFSIIVLNELKKLNLIPALIVTTPDKPQGRKQIITANVVKQWAIENNVAVITPEKFDSEIINKLKAQNCEVFIVASYGKILPNEVINIPPTKTLNIHPSLLPQYRGASPLQSAILNDTKNTGVTIMRIDEKMDHGPIIAQEKVEIAEWPIYDKFEEIMAFYGTELLAKNLPDWISGKITEKEQDHQVATYTKKFTKEDASIDQITDPYLAFRTIQAFDTWPKAFFTHEHNGKNIRVKIINAFFQNGRLLIKDVIPEGKNEMSYADFVRGYGKPKLAINIDY